MHEIVFLWAHPRSVSSAMERIMLERGDMKTFHEPFIYLYYVHDATKTLPYFAIDPDHPRSYEDIKQMLLAAAERGPVFVKDMCYYLSDYIMDDHAFVRRIRNTFLIRTPEKSIPSYYKLDPQLTSEEIGLEAEYRYFERVVELTDQTPIVIDAEDVQADTEATMRAYCSALGIEFIPESLHWDTAVPDAWQFVAGWHGDLSKTKGIAKHAESATLMDDNPRLQQYCQHHLPFYLALREHRLSPAKTPG